MNSSNAFKKLQLLHLVMALSLLFAIIIVFALLQSGVEPLSRGMQDSLFKIVPMGVVLGISASYYLGKKYLLKARKNKRLKEKLMGFQSMTVIKNICLELPGLLACGAALMTAEVQFLFIAFAVFAVMLIATPKQEKTIELLHLSPNETKEFNKLLEAE